MKLLKIPESKLAETRRNAEKMRRIAVAIERDQKGMKATNCIECGRSIMDDPFYCQDCDEALFS